MSSSLYNASEEDFIEKIGCTGSLGAETGCSFGATVVLLIGGLPGSGKSVLAQALKDRITKGTNDNHEVMESHGVCGNGTFTKFHYIEYDHLQNTILSEQNKMMDTQSPSDAGIEAWRKSRSLALDQLEEFLAYDASNTDEPTRENVLIVMDDNFHLRSMRKQIFQICHEQARQRFHQSAASTSDSKDQEIGHSAATVLASLWLDTPVDVCLKHNADRPAASRVSNETIHKIHSTAEPPSPGRETWEINIQTVNSGGVMKSEAVVDQVYQFVHELLVTGQPIKPQPTPEEEQERLERERALTLANQAHQLDQSSRRWVKAVAQIRPKDARTANQIRKEMIKEHQQPKPPGNVNTSCPNLDTDLFRVFAERVWEASNGVWTDSEKEKLLAVHG
mmetsp:Transcript_29541/g.61760  ORF Transcript_29541/g.61760 Transcript_29541/m.61760 type:complete len:392 (-) Transcript_29541:2067-3242(-)